MTRIEIDKKQLKRNVVDTFLYATWIYMILFAVAVALGVVGIVFGKRNDDTLTLTMGIACAVLAGISLAMIIFQFAAIHFVYLGKFKTNYPGGKKVFEIERVQGGYFLNNVLKNATATVHDSNIAKIAKTKNTIIIKLKRGTYFGFPRSAELDEVFK